MYSINIGVVAGQLVDGIFSSGWLGNDLGTTSVVGMTAWKDTSFCCSTGTHATRMVANLRGVGIKMPTPLIPKWPHLVSGLDIAENIRKMELSGSPGPRATDVDRVCEAPTIANQLQLTDAVPASRRFDCRKGVSCDNLIPPDLQLIESDVVNHGE